MKRLFYITIAVIAFGLVSCRKSSDDLTIKQFDQNSIQAYMSQNGLTGFKRDTTGGDTTGIYYQIISPGTGAVVDYPDLVSYVYTYHTFDGGYSTTDTITNHVNTYVGHITPTAVQIAVKNILKRKGGKIRFLVPSRLAFGINGYYSGAITINGNQCLDYTVSLVDNDIYLDPTTKKPVLADTTTIGAVKRYINNQDIYDDISIQKYMAANSLSGYTKSKSGLWYKVVTAGTGTDVINLASTVGVQYTGTLLDGTAFDTEVTTDGTAATSFTLYDVVSGFAEGLSKTTAGGQISLLIPSALGYGNSLSGTIPAFSCLRFEITVVTVSN
jgi:FKBP-type peptidyl-prolyl cis-trans isomerase FkpA